ncbi:SAM-dependent methyltransferase [Streptomyces albipurpureus]|uniref:SAM-dependent methyltransferase n=1 Tax=Streptomyces albipurpureus TaxID=2897419 RepID=A0ABT0UU13_9ACTN|nr:SAM-dependent methyltransferase [Streptomyces sp. CWNU-1]MCM2392077.1 SAM-dependent methyltransferase [Streptomyces sp. CWNU-1]
MTADPLGRGPDLDVSLPQSARVWNYWLGGRDNYLADREVGQAFQEFFPGIVDLAHDSRAFLARTVRHLAGEVGIRQFLDVGTGLPTRENTHQIAQRVAPSSRIVYVDNDPLVLAHARALLTGTAEGATDYLDADLHDPESIISQAASTLDFARPVALTLLQVVGHVADDEQARSVVDRLMAALPSGSYLVFNDSVDTHTVNALATRRYNESGATPYFLRSPEQIAAFFDGLELLEPGVVPLAEWRPDPAAPSDRPHEVIALGGVARKP